MKRKTGRVSTDLAAISLKGMMFSYPDTAPTFSKLDMNLPVGSRTLLVGANGVGKSTLLRIISGLHLLPREALQVFGKSPFYDDGNSGGLSRLLEDEFGLDVDLRVQELIDFNPNQGPKIDPRRHDELMKILLINPKWRMHRVSEGQRRRVQLLLGLRQPCQLLLLDEITTHLDVSVRARLLDWLKKENERHGLTILYATHIFDGMWAGRKGWPTHLAMMDFERSPKVFQPEKSADLKKQGLYSYCLKWIRASEKKAGKLLI